MSTTSKTFKEDFAYLEKEHPVKITIHHHDGYSPVIIENVILPYNLPMMTIVNIRSITKITIEDQ